MSEALRDAALTFEKIAIGYADMARTGAPVKRMKVRRTFVEEALSDVQRLAEQDARDREKNPGI